MSNKSEIARMSKDCIESFHCDKNDDLQYECLNIQRVDDALGIDIW